MYFKKQSVIIIILILLLILILIMLSTLTFTESYTQNKEYDYKILMFLTEGLCDEAENCIKTIQNQGMENNLIVTTLDRGAYKCMHKLGVNVVHKETNLKKEANFGSKDFYEIVYNKLEIIETNLEKYNGTVVYSDSDIVYLQDISADVAIFNNSEYDIMFQNDVADFNENNKHNLCSGFMFFKNNKRVLDCLRQAKKIMKTNWDNRKWDTNGGADQKAMNEAIKVTNVRVGTLDLKDYPNGSRYFNNIDSIYKEYQPKMIHNNYIVGTAAKINRFKKHGLWFIP